MRRWLNRQLDRAAALGIEIILVLLFAWESVLEHHHNPHTCHHEHCHTCAQISAIKSIIHYISLYQISLVAAAVTIPLRSPCISAKYQEDKSVSLVRLKVRMDN